MLAFVAFIDPMTIRSFGVVKQGFCSDKTMIINIPRAHKFFRRAVAVNLTILMLVQIFFLYSESVSVEGFDVVSGVVESPEFKGKEIVNRLSLASEMLKENKLSRVETSYLLLDWVDQYLREPTDPMDRLRRWGEFSKNDKFSNLKVPRDFLNRVLVAEYLEKQPGFSKAAPHKKLETLRKLQKKNLLEWSVALSYENLIAGSIINGAKVVDPPTPLDSLTALKKLREENLIGNHYRVMVEGLLAAEALARDMEFHKASPMERLIKLRDLEKKGLITSPTKKELEKIPAWRLIINDPAFLRLDASQKKDRLSSLRNDGLLTASTISDFLVIFKGVFAASSSEQKPPPIPQSGPSDR